MSLDGSEKPACAEVSGDGENPSSAL